MFPKAAAFAPAPCGPTKLLTDAAGFDLVYRGFQKLCTDAFLAAPARGDRIARKVASSGASGQYSWLGAFPALREWIGPRVVGNLDASSFTIVNRMFESTVRVSRNHIVDDRIGVFAPQRPHLMTALVPGTCDPALAPGAPEWVQLFPDGPINGRDGRSWELPDPDAPVAAFQSGGIDLPVDYEHQNDNPDARPKGPVPAAGWIKELRAGAGLWGLGAMDRHGGRDDRQPRISHHLGPSFLFRPETQPVVRLKGAGLVHHPDLHLTALAGEQPPKAPAAPDADMVQRILAAPGLPPDASPDQIADAFARIEALRELVTGKPTAAAASPDPARYVPVSAVAEMLRGHSGEPAARTEDRVLAKVKGAFREGCFNGGMRDRALALCRSDEAAFDSFIARSLPPYAHLLKRSHTNASPARGTTKPGSDAAAAVCSLLGPRPDALDT